MNLEFWTIMALISAPCMASFGMLMGDRWKPETRLGVYARSITNSQSICDVCAKPINALALTPIFGWLFYFGRCQCRKQKVSWTYPAGEMAAFILMAIALGLYGLKAYPLLLVIAGLAAAVRSDIAHCEIHEISAGVTFAGALTFWWFNDQSYQTLIIAVSMLALTLVVYEFYRRKGRIDAIPLGDIMIIGALSPLFSMDRGLSFFVGLAFGAILTKRLLRQKTEIFPFAPAIAIATALCLVPTHFFTHRLDMWLSQIV